MLRSQRPIRLAGLFVCVVATYALAGCKQEVAFTRVPQAATTETAPKANNASIFVGLPVDLARVEATANAALPDRVAKVLDWIGDAACDRRGSAGLQCMDGKAEGEISRAGAVRFSSENGRLMLQVPLKYDITMRGVGWSAYLRDRKSGELTASIPFEANLVSGFRLDVRAGAEIIWSQKAVPLLKGKVGLPKFADARLRAALKETTEALRVAVQGPGFRDGADRAWRGLHAPIQIASKPQLWLRGAPERVAGAGFVLDNGQASYRIAVATRLSVHAGERPAPLFQKPMPEPARVAASLVPQKTVVRVPFDISTAPMQRAIALAFHEKDEIETLADPKLPTVVVRPSKATVYPSNDKLALELQLDVVTPARMFGMTGKAYFTGRPVLDAETGTIELADVGFPSPAPKETKAGRQQILRIGEEPFAGRFASAARMNIGRELAEFLPRLNASINQQVDDTLQVVGAFEKVDIVSIEPVRDAFRVNLDLTGTIELRSVRPAVAGDAGAIAAEPPSAIAAVFGRR